MSGSADSLKPERLLIGSESDKGIEQAWNWTVQLNEAAMLLFALLPWIFFTVFTSPLLIF
ncbi:MAG TPA: hypothetical protein VKR55_00620 [Bradyrhizobium sp.]|uniref:hypothetical protein n=1 Tax=Bradyrhizobium sp. TaxID=376 RepID=UPI002CC4B588|nr:hypothetical protein [Bradyrhizobium sp.]HLZ00631.1 hypothetical protein [Bradyrhizobium sp.]